MTTFNKIFLQLLTLGDEFHFQTTSQSRAGSERQSNPFYVVKDCMKSRRLDDNGSRLLPDDQVNEIFLSQLLGIECLFLVKKSGALREEPGRYMYVMLLQMSLHVTP